MSPDAYTDLLFVIWPFLWSILFSGVQASDECCYPPRRNVIHCEDKYCCSAWSLFYCCTDVKARASTNYVKHNCGDDFPYYIIGPCIGGVVTIVCVIVVIYLVKTNKCHRRNPGRTMAVVPSTAAYPPGATAITTGYAHYPPNAAAFPPPPAYSATGPPTYSTVQSSAELAAPSHTSTPPSAFTYNNPNGGVEVPGKNT